MITNSYVELTARVSRSFSLNATTPVMAGRQVFWETRVTRRVHARAFVWATHTIRGARAVQSDEPKHAENAP